MTEHHSKGIILNRYQLRKGIKNSIQCIIMRCLKTFMHECDIKQYDKGSGVVSYCSVALPELPRTVPALGKYQQ